MTAAQNVFLPRGMTSFATGERVLPLPGIVNSAFFAVLGLVSACIVCFSKARHTKLKTILLTAVYFSFAPFNIIFSRQYTLNLAYNYSSELLGRYSILDSYMSAFGLLFTLPATILFFFSLGRYFYADRLSEAEPTEAAEK